MRIRNKLIAGISAAVLAVASSSCRAPQNVSYFQDANAIVSLASAQPIKMKPGDKIQIVVKTKDAAVSDLFNLPVYSSRIGQSAEVNGKTVDSREYRPSSTEGTASYTITPQGTIDFPVLGELKIEGMTRSELAGFIKGELMGRDLVKEATVTVEFVSAGVSIMGEVSHPGRYDVNIDNFTLLEALSLAGDLTINGRRENVRVLREENGEMHVYTVDLTNLKELTASPVYSLQQNDVVYVEPNDQRKRQSTVNGNNALSTSFWISVASLLTTAVTTVGVFVNR